MPDTAMRLDVENTLTVIGDTVRTAMVSAHRLIQSAYGRGRKLDPRVIKELRQTWETASMDTGYFMRQAHTAVCTNCHSDPIEAPVVDVTPRGEAATQREAVRILINTGKCSRYMANRAYAALRHAGLL